MNIKKFEGKSRGQYPFFKKSIVKPGRFFYFSTVTNLLAKGYLSLLVARLAS